MAGVTDNLVREPRLARSSSNLFFTPILYSVSQETGLPGILPLSVLCEALLKQSLRSRCSGHVSVETACRSRGGLRQNWVREEAGQR